MRCLGIQFVYLWNLEPQFVFLTHDFPSHTLFYPVSCCSVICSRLKDFNDFTLICTYLHTYLFFGVNGFLNWSKCLWLTLE